MDKLLKSDVNFQRVRDGRNALPFYFDLDLSTARSVAAGTHFIANVAGDSFYADADPSDGNCRVHFQDTNLDRAAVPFYVSPGFIANVPFTQMLIENAAQPGKKIRIAYGVDIDFQPGSVAQIAVSNSGGYTAVRQENYLSGIVPIALAAGAVQLLAPAANIKGFQIYDLQATGNASSGGSGTFLAKNGAPTSLVDGDGLGSVGVLSFNINNYVGGKVSPVLVPAGKGIYFYGVAGSVYVANTSFATLVGHPL